MAEYIKKETIDRIFQLRLADKELWTETEIQVAEWLKADIDTLPTETVKPVNMWISVKDKLPEVGKVVIVCDKQGGVGAMELLSNGQWYHRGMAWSAEWILYWQPLPEPPETINLESRH